MVSDRRVTLRCLVDDLTGGWDDAEHARTVKALRVEVGRALGGQAQESSIAKLLRRMPRLNGLNHPLIRHFDTAFGPGEDPTSRESISGLTGPHWWKVKTNRWRGAAIDHSVVGPDAVWLCAAGIRREGDGDDFYSAFMRNVRRAGPDQWLPSAEDVLAATVDEKISALDSWKLQVHCAALALLTEALDNPGQEFSVMFPAPSRRNIESAIGQLSLSLESIDVDGQELVEVFLTAKILDRAQLKAVDVAVQIARAALQSNAEEWHSTTYTENSYAFSAVLEPTARSHSDALKKTGELPTDASPGNLRLGVRAHYARKHGLVDAQVDGDAVLSLCGYWFVPTKDHEEVETCAECLRQYENIPTP